MIRIDVNKEEIAEFCRKWRIKEFSFFGSVLRKDFGPESDVDVLVEFEEGADWGLFEHIAMEDELSGILGRRSEIVTRKSLLTSRNPIRRESILSSAMPYHAT